jgi:hypothetical protein
MTLDLVQRISGGYRVDGLDLLEGNCNHQKSWGSPEAAAGHQTYSTVKRVGNVVAYFAKAATPQTGDNYEWGYRVKKGAVEVDVLVYDTWNRHRVHFRGHYPPALSAWEKCGWEIMAQFERPLKTQGKLREE